MAGLGHNRAIDDGSQVADVLQVPSVLASATASVRSGVTQ